MYLALKCGVDFTGGIPPPDRYTPTPETVPDLGLYVMGVGGHFWDFCVR